MLTAALSMSDRIQSNQRPGAKTNDRPTTRSVAPTAIVRDRHSRRTANHSSPTPGVTFVRRMNAQAAGYRKPTTIASAMSISMLPRMMSMPTTTVASAPISHQRVTATRAAPRIAYQTARKTG